jgi:hypothetical protein
VAVVGIRGRWWRGPCGICSAGRAAGEKREEPAVEVIEDAADHASTADDGQVGFVPNAPVDLTGHYAEVAAGICDGTPTGRRRTTGSSPVACLDGDFVLGQQTRERRVQAGVHGLGIGRRDVP